MLLAAATWKSAPAASTSSLRSRIQEDEALNATSVTHPPLPDEATAVTNHTGCQQPGWVPDWLVSKWCEVAEASNSSCVMVMSPNVTEANELVMKYVPEKSKMPYYMQALATASKLFIILLVLGPESTEASMDEKSWMALGKRGFQWLLLGLFCSVLALDVAALMQLFSTDGGHMAWWQLYFAACSIWGNSSNVQVGAAMHAMGHAFTQHLAFPQCHKTRQQFEWDQDDDGRLMTSERLILESKGLAAWFIRGGGVDLYLWPLVVFTMPLMVSSGLLFPWIGLVSRQLGGALSRGFANLALCLKRRNAKPRNSDDEQQLVANEQSIEELIDVEEIRSLYMNMVIGKQHVLKECFRLETDDSLREKYEKDLEFFAYLGTTYTAMKDLAAYQLILPLFISWGPSLLLPILEAFVFGADACTWGWGGFCQVYWSALVSTFGSRHWWLYRDYVMKNAANAIATVNSFI